MADQTFVAIAAQYPSEEKAVEAFDQLRTHFAEREKHGSFDAAVINRGLDGKVVIAKRDDGGKRHGARTGLSIGLASGLAVALFPAVALGSALVVVGGSGAGIGAIASHIGRKTPSKDLEAISETLDAGSAGVVLVLDPSDADEVQKLLAESSKLTVKDLSVDSDELDEEVDIAYE